MEVQENLPQHSVTYIWKCKRTCSSVACMLLPHPTPPHYIIWRLQKNNKKPTKRWFGFQPVGMNYNTHKLEDEATVWRIQRNIYIYIYIYIYLPPQKNWLNQAETNSDFKLKKMGHGQGTGLMTLEDNLSRRRGAVLQWTPCSPRADRPPVSTHGLFKDRATRRCLAASCSTVVGADTALGSIVDVTWLYSLWQFNIAKITDSNR